MYKLANEGTARIFWDDEGVASIGIRPYIVYGPGRDQGMTSGPTLAMAAAARGEGFEIGYGGTAQYDYAPDVGRAFVLAARAASEGAHVANFPGEPSTMQDVVAAIEAAAPEAAGSITWPDTRTSVPRVARVRPSGAARRPAPPHATCTTAFAERSSTFAPEPSAAAGGARLGRSGSRA